MKARDQETIFNNLWWQDSKVNINLGKLAENSKEMTQIMRSQNNITQNAFSLARGLLTLTRDALKLLEDSHENKEILRYRDWVTELIHEINYKLDRLENINGSVAWNTITRAFTIKIKNKMIDFIPDAREYINLLKEILGEVNITLEEFELLMKFKWTRNDEFHTKRWQTEEEALEALEQFSFPKDLKCYMDPLKKAIGCKNLERAFSC